MNLSNFGLMNSWLDFEVDNIWENLIITLILAIDNNKRKSNNKKIIYKLSYIKIVDMLFF